LKDSSEDEEVSRMWGHEIERLEAAGIQYRLSYKIDWHGHEGYLQVQKLVDKTISKPRFKDFVSSYASWRARLQTTSLLTQMYENENGFCKVCENDFNDNETFCSEEYEEVLIKDLVAQIVSKLPRCKGCRVILTDDSLSQDTIERYNLPDMRKPLKHHVSYEDDETVLVCALCHAKIHGEKLSYMDSLKPRDKRPEKPKRRTKLVPCKGCLQQARVHFDYEERTALCSECRRRLRPRVEKYVPCRRCNGRARISFDDPREDALCSRCRKQRKRKTRTRWRSRGRGYNHSDDALRNKFA
jgi:hypothetical protein